MRQQYEWNVTSLEDVKLKSSISHAEPEQFGPVANISRDISQPQMLTLVPGGVTDPLFMRNIVLSAFKLAVRVVPMPWPGLNELLAMPTGNIIFSIRSPMLRIINTLTFKDVGEAVFVGLLPRGLALSPDAKLLYITAELSRNVSV